MPKISRANYYLIFLLLIVSIAVKPTYAVAKQNLNNSFCGIDQKIALTQACKEKVVCKTNRNQSIFLAITSQCSDNDADLRVYFYETKNSKPILIHMLQNQEVKSIDFSQQANNDYAELNVTESCGAGPNCIQTLYRYDPYQKKLYSYFSGGFANYEYFDGYLVESAKDSCCSWEFHAHPIHKEGLREKVDEQFFVISVTSMAQNGDSKPAICRFYEYIGNGQKIRTIQPPNKKWLSYCEIYGSSYEPH